MSSLVPWGLFLLALAGAGTFYVTRYRPLEKAHSVLIADFNERSVEHEALRTALSKLESKHADLLSDQKRLRSDLDQATAEKKAALAELAKTKTELSTKLGDEIAAGDVLIEQRGDRLVVDVADKILFPAGEAEVTERGQEVLKEVATTLSQSSRNLIQVGGHTDNTPIVSKDTLERFPTNWELSTARATNVVRLLQSQGIPGSRLMAAGFAEYRPAMTNNTKAGRRRNRRIEIVLLQAPQ